MSWIIAKNDGAVLLKIYVQPGASRNEIVGVHNDVLKLRLTTPPVDGKANKAVLAFLAKTLGCPKSSLSLKSGHRNRNKVVVIDQCPAECLRQLSGMDFHGEE